MEDASSRRSGVTENRALDGPPRFFGRRAPSNPYVGPGIAPPVRTRIRRWLGPIRVRGRALNDTRPGALGAVRWADGVGNGT